MPEAGLIKQLIIQPVPPGASFDGPINFNTITLSVDLHNRASVKYSRSVPPDVDFDASTGEVWDLNVNFFTGDAIQITGTTNKMLNTGGNSYKMAITGTWLRDA